MVHIGERKKVLTLTADINTSFGIETINIYIDLAPVWHSDWYLIWHSDW